MSEQWQTGTPATEGWYRCKTISYSVALYWKDVKWYYGPDGGTPEWSISKSGPIYGFQGPLGVLEPSVGAREIADEWIKEYQRNSDVGLNMDDAMYAATESAFARGKEEGLLKGLRDYQDGYARGMERGKEEGYREAMEQCARLAVRRSCSWSAQEDERSDDYRQGIEDAASQLAKCFRATSDIATEPPAQPAATEPPEKDKVLRQKFQQTLLNAIEEKNQREEENTEKISDLLNRVRALECAASQNSSLTPAASSKISNTFSA